MAKTIWSAGEEILAADINTNFYTNFGGDGTDGALSVAAGTTNIDASGANIVIKNYTSISIASGATLALTNKAAGGTILILRSQGNVTIEGLIDLEGDGAAADTNGFSILDYSADHEGGSGANGSGSTGGAAGTIGAILNLKDLYSTPDAIRLYKRVLNLACGSGGGTGGAGDGTGTPGAGGAGGAGGGVLIIECAKALDFDVGGEININGTIGTNGGDASGDNGGGGGGGGGTAGMALVLYNTLTDNSGTINAKGGAGGDGGEGGGGGSGDGGGGGGGAGSGSYTTAGKAGGAGSNRSAGVGDNGTNTNDASGAGGGGGAGNDNPIGPAGGTGGTQGATDANHYLVTENKFL